MVVGPSETPNHTATAAPTSTTCWWSDWAKHVSGSPGDDLHYENRIDSFSRYCHGQFFSKALSHAQYFECGTLIWMVKLLEEVDSSSSATTTNTTTRDPRGLGCTAQELQHATSKVVMMTTIKSSSSQTCQEGMASWLLPKWENEDLQNLSMNFKHANGNPDETDGDRDDEDDMEEKSVQWMLRFWNRFYELITTTTTATNANNNITIQQQPPFTKRQRTTYQYYSTQRNQLDDLMKGSYKLPTAILCIRIALELCNTTTSWETITHHAYGLQKAWKTLTSENIRAALTVVGLECLLQGRQVKGLTSLLMLEFLTRSGESTLSVLKNAMQLDYYPLRAAICEHLLEPVYSPSLDPNGGGGASSLTEEQIQVIIQACNDFMNREQPLRFLNQLLLIDPDSNKGDDAPQIGNKRKQVTTNAASVNVPERITNPRFPLMTHLAVWLLQDNTPRAMELVRHMEQSSRVDGLWKDEAYLIIWDHLLRHGKVFLDGNGTHSAPYIERRELLYNGIVSGMGPYGRGSMIDFYQTLAQTVWDKPQATLEEKHYVLVACQQTLLRLCIKCRGLGRTTIVQFLRETSWPVACQELVSTNSSSTTQVDDWAMEFLRFANPIPASLVSEDGVLNLSALIDEPPSSTSVTNPAPEPVVPPLILPDQEQPPPLDSMTQAVIPHVPPFSTTQQINVLETKTLDPAAATEETGLEQSESEAHDEQEEKEEEEDDDDSFCYEEEEPELSDGRDEEEVLAEQEKVIELDDDDEENDDDDDDDDNDEQDEQEDHSARASESSDATAEMSDEDPSPGFAQGRVPHRFEDSHDEMEYSREEEENIRGDHEESSSAEDEDEPRREHRDYSSSSEAEEDIGGEEESSDGDDDDRDDDDAEQEAVVIRDSESEGVDDAAPVNDLVHHQVREHYERQGAGAVDQFEDADDESDVVGEESDGNRPHRIAQGVVHDGTDDESDDESMQGPRDDVNRVEAQGSSDEEDEEDEDEAAQDDRNVAVAHEPIEIIDEDSQGEDREQSQLASISREPETPESDVGRGKVYQNPGADVARVMASMFESAPGDDVEYRSRRAAINEGGVVDDADSDTKMPAQNIPKKTDADLESLGDAKGNPTSEGTNKESENLSPRGEVDAGYEDTLQEAECESSGGHELQEDNIESDATDDEEERAVADEKDDTEDVAADGDFGDTTEEEVDQVTSSRANKLADADRRADVLRAKSWYASHVEDGYEPEDTHGYTEEEVSEAIHTEDEEEEHPATQEPRHEVSQPHRERLESVEQSLPHSSDDMDAADEHTEHEEDLGAESSELEENAEPKQYPYSPPSECERDPTTLLEFAQSAQRLHQYGTGAPSKATRQQSGAKDEATPNLSGEKSVGVAESRPIEIDANDTKVSASIPAKTEAADDSPCDIDADRGSQIATSDNFASVEDEKDVESTMATESLDMTEDTVDHADSDDPETAKTDGPDDIDDHDIEDRDETASEQPPASPTIGASEEMAVDPEDAKDTIHALAMETDTHPGIEEEMDVDVHANKADDEVMVDAEDSVDDVAMEAAVVDDLLVESTGDDDIMDVARIDKPTEGSKGADAPMETQPIDDTEVQSTVSKKDSPVLDPEDRLPPEAPAQEETDNQAKEVDVDDAVAVTEADRPDEEDSASEAAQHETIPARRGKLEQDTLPPNKDESEETPKSSSLTVHRPTRKGPRAKPLAEGDDDSVGESVESFRQPRRATRSARSKKTVGGDDESVVSAEQAADESKSVTEVSTTTRSRAQKRATDDESVASSRRSTRNRGRKADASDDATGSDTSKTRSRAKVSVGGAITETNDREQSVASSTRRSSRGRAKKEEEDETTPRTSRSTRSRGKGIVAGSDNDSVVSAKNDDERSVASSTRRSTRGRSKKASSADEDDDSARASNIQITGNRDKNEDVVDGDESVVSTGSRRLTRFSKAKDVPADEEENEDVHLVRKSSRRRPAPAAAKDDEEEEAPKRTSRVQAVKKAGLPPLAPTRRSARKK